MKPSFYQKLTTLFILILALTGCNPDNDNPIADVNREIYALMKEYYFWYEYLPRSDPEGYSDPNEYLRSLRYTPYDRWSIVIPKDVYYQYFVSGEMVGHGFVIISDADGNVRIGLIYPATQAYSSGVRRGWIIRKVNGNVATSDNINTLIGASQSGLTNNFQFINNSGDIVEIALTKEGISLNPVVYSTVINQGGRKTGYFVFQDFIDVAEVRLNEVFSAFKQENIEDLIIDLRYNGGGSVDIANHLAGWLTGNKNAGDTLINIIHNNKLTGRDTSCTIDANANSLDLDRIIFIGLEGTASASELIINGLEPYMNVELIGTPTHGKPVGMYSFLFKYENYAVLPICFKYTNADNYGDFYDGLQPDILVDDDLTKDFGDVNEAMLKTALEYISGGTITTRKSTALNKSNLLQPQNTISEFQRAF